MNPLRLFPRFSLPLVTKDLTEQAARPRTYVIRAVSALALFCTFAWMVWAQLSFGRRGLAMLGHGDEVFAALAALLGALTMIVLPIITCGAITEEKERNTLPLLFITKLTPAAIVVEKLLARLIPMWTLYLTAVPVMALAYTLGGVDLSQMFIVFWGLINSSLLVASFTLACSAFCQTTLGAFALTVVLGPAFLFVFSCCGSGLMVPFWVFGMRTFVGGAWQNTVFALVASSLTGFVPSLLFLVFARVFLVERATVQRRSYLMRFLRSLDQRVDEANQRFAGGVVLIGDRGALPDTEPITWLERNRRSLGTARYIIRALLVLELPAVLIAFGTFDGSAGLVLFVGAIVMLLVALKASGLISGERRRETLDVLLTLPLSGREILKQKFAAVSRLISILTLPPITLLVLPTITGGRASWTLNQGIVVETAWIAVSVAMILIWAHTIGWLAFYFGTRLKSQIRALALVLGIVTAWMLLGEYFEQYTYPVHDSLTLLWNTADSLGIDETEVISAELVRMILGGPQRVIENLLYPRRSGLMQIHVPTMFLCFLFYAAVWLAIRTWTLRRADALLQRL